MVLPRSIKRGKIASTSAVINMILVWMLRYFFATFCGNGAFDGIDAIMKWPARKASMQNPYVEQIMTPK
jgi:hypothetical protein